MINGLSAVGLTRSKHCMMLLGWSDIGPLGCLMWMRWTCKKWPLGWWRRLWKKTTLRRVRHGPSIEPSPHSWRVREATTIVWTATPSTAIPPTRMTRPFAPLMTPPSIAGWWATVGGWLSILMLSIEDRRGRRSIKMRGLYKSIMLFIHRSFFKSKHGAHLQEGLKGLLMADRCNNVRELWR